MLWQGMGTRWNTWQPAHAIERQALVSELEKLRVWPWREGVCRSIVTDSWKSGKPKSSVNIVLSKSIGKFKVSLFERPTCFQYFWGLSDMFHRYTWQFEAPLSGTNSTAGCQWLFFDIVKPHFQQSEIRHFKNARLKFSKHMPASLRQTVPENVRRTMLTDVRTKARASLKSP